MKKVLKDIFSFSSFTLISRIIGFIRDLLAAFLFGTGKFWDDFLLAFGFANLVRRFFGEGAFSFIFIPEYIKREKEGLDALDFASKILSSLITLLFYFCLITGGIFWILHLYISSYFLEYMYLMSIYMFFLGIGISFAVSLQVYGKFSPLAIYPIVMNCGFVIVFIGGKYTNIPPPQILKVLCIVLVAIGVSYSYRLLVFLKRHGVRIRCSFTIPEEFWNTLKHSFPIILSMFLVQINTIIDRVMLKLFVPYEGSISSVYFSERLFQLPLALIGISITTIVFPTFARLKEDLNYLILYVRKVFFVLVFTSLLISFFLSHFSFSVVKILFFRGNFSFESLTKVSDIFSIYIYSLVFYSLIHLWLRIFYAFEDRFTPLYINTGTTLLKIPINYLLIKKFYEEGFALSMIISSSITVLIFMFILHKKYTPK